MIREWDLSQGYIFRISSQPIKVKYSGAVAGGARGGHGPPGKNLLDNFDACRKFLKFLFVKFKKCSFLKYSVL